jgi:hypothetical protein
MFNSFWFIGLLVFAAVLLTSVTSSSSAKRYESTDEQHLTRSYFMAVSHTGNLPQRPVRQQ